MYLKTLFISLGCWLLLSGSGIQEPDLSKSASASYGQIVWYTLVTPNLNQSVTFYRSIFNWNISTFEISGQKAAIVSYGGKPMASIVELTNADAAVWIPTVSTTDLDATVKKFSSNGGKALLKPFEIKKTGKQAVLEGPLGEKIGFIENASNPVSQLSNGDQQWIWTELWSTDTQRSINFYKNVLNIEISNTQNDNKPYWLMSISGEKVAGMIKNPLEGARSQWAPYINIRDIPDFYQKLKATGTRILLSPDNGYRNGKVVIFEDPQNALVCVQQYP